MGVVGFCFYLITIVNTLPGFYHALTWLSFSVLASSLAIAVLSLIGLRAAWRVPHAVVTEGVGHSEEGPVIEVQMSNIGTLNKTGVLIEVQLERVSKTEAQTSKAPKARLKRRFLMEALPSGNSLQTSLPLLHLPRGRYRVVELKLVGSDTLGLFRIQKRISPNVSFASVLQTGKNQQNAPAAEQVPGKPTGAELVIGPAALARHDITLSPLLMARGDGGVSATRFLGQGEDVRGTRLYAAGDDLRHVHWKSTARKGQLVVKEFHHTVQEHVLVVWDGAAQTRWGEIRENEVQALETIWQDAAAESGFNTEEWSLRIAASLCRALLENRRPCALLRLDTAAYAIGMGAAAGSTAAQYSGLSMEQVSEALADATSNRETSLQEALQPFHTNRQTGEVYFVTSSLSPEVARAAGRWRLEGARVIIALVNGAAFSSAVAADRHSVPGKSSSIKRALPAAPIQSWTSADGASGRTAVTEAGYQEQARALRAAGARVVMIAPRGDSRDFLAPINSALQELFDKTASVETFHSSPESSSTVVAPLSS